MTTQDDIAGFKEWYDAVWLGDKEHGQFIPKTHDLDYLEYLNGYTLAHGAWQAAIAHERQLKPVLADDVRYVTQIAVYMHDKFFKAKSPIFEPLDTVDGILSQIDNMVCGIPAISNTNEAVGKILVTPHGVCKFEKAQGKILAYGEHQVFTTPPQSQSVKDALEAAAKIAERYEPDEKQDYITYASREIRTLITDKKEG